MKKILPLYKKQDDLEYTGKTVPSAGALHNTESGCCGIMAIGVRESRLPVVKHRWL